VKRKYYAADLFCGAGGTSTGLLKAAKRLGLNVELIAINHWDVAIATHSLNHPNVNHMNSDLEKVDPRKVVPGGKLRLLVASPECTHFSKARGGKPMSKQSRASVKYILRWVGALEIENVIIENVSEFMDWGPLHRKHSKNCKPDSEGNCNLKTCQIDKPIKNRKGEYFHRFIRKMQAHGYQVKWRVLNAADYGDPTTRKRLFVMARKNGNPVFPEPTHAKIAEDMFGKRLTWRPAREIIDRSIKSASIFNREARGKKPLAPNTMRRIMAGLFKFGGKAFVIGQQSGAAPRSTDDPLPAVAGAGAISFVEPFLVTTNWTATNRSKPRSISEPIPAITGQGQIGLVEPFLVMLNGTSEDALKKSNRSIDEPLPTITAKGNHLGLVEPFIIPQFSEGAPKSVNEPLGAITTTSRGIGLVEPFLIPYHTEHENQKPRSHSLNEPLPTVHAGGVGFGLVEPFIMPVNHGKNDHRAYSLDDPMPTVTSVDAWSYVEPYLVEYYGTGSASSVDEPLKTQTGRDRFGLVQPMVFEYDGKKYLLDIHFRMLQPHELARAMSFPKNYKFKGTREQIVKQIGNAVPVELAAALCEMQLQ
jgi:DNA (cytosine-5)-methyltransferase 1